MPYYGEGQEAEEKMLMQIREAIHPENLKFDEG